MEKLTLQDPQPRVANIDNESLKLVEQITLINLDYARAFLTEHEKRRSGVRLDLRQELIQLLEEEPGLRTELRALLDELDLWGNQRIRLRHFPQSMLRDLKTPEAVKKRARAEGMSGLLNGKVALEPPEQTTPMSISYEERDKGRFLKLVAAKTRVRYVPVPNTKVVRFDEYPDMVFRMFTEEKQKVVNFAEINLDTGHAVISSPLVRPGFTTTTDFTDFYDCFSSFLPLRDGAMTYLYDATHHIRHLLRTTDVIISGRKTRTDIGGTVNLRAFAPEQDIRKDPQLRKVEKVLPDARSPLCNCYWAPVEGLEEIVHTHVLAEGEVVIMGQARERSVRHVLRRIHSINRAKP